MEKLYRILKILIVLLLAAVLVAGILVAKQLALPRQSEPVAEAGNASLAPDFTFYDIDGNAFKLSDLRGEPVVLNFWASWCGPCKMEMPHFQAAYEQYGEDVHFLMVNMSTAFGDSRADAATVLEEGGYTFPVYYDDLSECAYAYGINAIPVTAFIDADGNLVSMKTGAMNAADLDRRIQTILG